MFINPTLAWAKEWYGMLETLSTCLFLGAIVWLKYFEKYEKLTVGFDTVSTEDYSICVKNLPESTTREDLRRHFSLYPINQIHLVEDNHAIIKMLKKLEREKQKENESSSSSSSSITRTSRELANARIEYIKQKIRDKRMNPSQDAPAIHAFVTFENARHADQVLKKYQYGNWWHFYTQYYDLRLHHKDRLYIVPASSPTTILWENLLVKKSNQCYRQGITWIISLLIVGISFVFLAWTKLQEQYLFLDQAMPPTVSLNSSSASASADGLFPENGQGQKNSLSVEDMDKFCKTPENCIQYLKTNMYSMMGSVAVVVVNFILSYIMEYSSLFEKHHSLNTKTMSTAFKLFILQFINTSLLLLLVNASDAIPLLSSNDKSMKINGTDISLPHYGDFLYPTWYETVGKSIMYSMIFNIVTPHISQLILYAKCCRHSLWSYRKSSSESWDFSIRYASIYSTIFSCIMFSTGYPVLYPILAASMIVRYWVDKYLFLKISKECKEHGNDIPAYTITLQQVFSQMLVIAWLIHLGVGIWMLSYEQEQEQEQDKHQKLDIWVRITGTEWILVLFVLFTTLGTVVFLYYIVNDQLLHFISCGFHRRKRRRRDHRMDIANMLTFTEALDRNLVTTYSLFDLPRYKSKFYHLLQECTRDRYREHEISHIVDQKV